MMKITTAQKILLSGVFVVFSFVSVGVLAAEGENSASKANEKSESRERELKKAIEDAFKKSYFPHPQSKKGLSIVSFELNEAKVVSNIEVSRVPSYKKSGQPDGMAQKALVFAVKNLGKLPTENVVSKKIKVRISIDNRSDKEKLEVKINPETGL